jgi:hypothetical protein
MPTLRAILCDQFGFRPADFGSADNAIWIDSRRGTIRPAGSTDPAMTIPISGVFQIGDEITIVPHADSSNKARFTILSINEDGFSVLFANGSAGFLPWEILSYGISNPSSVEIDRHTFQTRSDLADDTDLAQAELKHMNDMLNEHYREISLILERIKTLTDRLQEPSLDLPSHPTRAHLDAS